ncbi:MAG: aminopeptidase P N-terminal domain-containing protein [Ignavibacteria bacterium]
MKFCSKAALFLFLQLVLCFQSFSQQFESSVFKERRGKITQQASDGIIVLESNPEVERNHDVTYDYRQGSDFYYLTGFEEPSSAIIIDPASDKPYTLFVQLKDLKKEVWTGILTGTEDAVSVYGADNSYSIKKFDSTLQKYIKEGRKIYYPKSNDRISAIISKTSSVVKTADVTALIAELRLFKSEYEIEMMQKSIDITCDGLIACMKSAKPGMYEYQIQAVLEYNFRIAGSPRNGFPSIVGSGPNATILHYETNRRLTEDGDMVVMDVGAEFGYYSADVTRTFPVNGKFSPAQKRIYSIVLAAQTEAMEFIKPGVRFNQVDSVARSVVHKGLVALGMIQESDNTSRFFMHGTSHWLGLDVHDAGSYSSGGKGNRILEPGMVLTVEPGIYIKDGTAGVDAEYYNIGVRIEDDVLVTRDGFKLLSGKAPREINEIEKLMSEGK